jgi:hypothetical protein
VHDIITFVQNNTVGILNSTIAHSVADDEGERVLDEELKLSLAMNPNVVWESGIQEPDDIYRVLYICPRFMTLLLGGDNAVRLWWRADSETRKIQAQEGVRTNVVDDAFGLEGLQLRHEAVGNRRGEAVHDLPVVALANWSAWNARRVSNHAHAIAGNGSRTGTVKLGHVLVDLFLLHVLLEHDDVLCRSSSVPRPSLGTWTGKHWLPDMAVDVTRAARERRERREMR